MNEKDHFFIRKANELAWESGARGFSPFGALLVYQDLVVAESMDACIVDSDPTGHPELRVISKYCRQEQKISLEGYTLYSSTEPCAMCSGAIHWARIDRVVFSVSQEMLQQKSGGKPKLNSDRIINSGGRKIAVVGPVLPEEGMQIFENYPQLSKQLLHQKYHAGRK